MDRTRYERLAYTLMGVTLLSTPLTLLAGVKIYGSAHVEYSVEDLDGQSAEQGIGDSAVRSRIGIKATEKLSSRLKAIAVLEFRADPSGDNNGLSNRQLFVGLKHKEWGFIGLGSFVSPYRSAGGARLDPFWETALQTRGAGAMTTARGTANNVNGRLNGVIGNEGFIQSAIFYKSPKWQGMHLEYAISPDEKARGVKDGEVVNASGGDDNDFAVSWHYRNGPIWLFAAYGENNIEGRADEQAWKVGTQVGMGKHTVAFQYEWVNESFSLDGGLSANLVSDFSAITAGEDGEVWFLGYQYKMGNNILVAQFGQTDSTGGDQSNNAEYMAFGIIHKLSNKTKVFAGYSESDGNLLADREVISVGLRKDF